MKLSTSKLRPLLVLLILFFFFHALSFAFRKRKSHLRISPDPSAPVKKSLSHSAVRATNAVVAPTMALPEQRRRASKSDCRRRLSLYVAAKARKPLEGKILATWGPDLTECGALFTLLRTCFATSPLYGVTPLPNFYRYVVNDASSQEMKSRYTRANIGFVHLPKTGGTSIESLFSRYVKNKKSYSVRRCDYFSSAAINNIPSPPANVVTNRTSTSLLEKKISYLLDADNKVVAANGVGIAGYRKIYGSKRNYGMHEFIQNTEDFLYVVWFREPVSKMLSMYYYLRSPKGGKGGKGHIHSEPAARLSNTLADFVKHPHFKRAPQFNNHYIRLLTFGEFPELDSQFDDIPLSMISSNHDLPNITETHYLAAKRNLVSKIALVGIMEQFALSQQMLCTMIGVNCPQAAVWKNANKHKPDGFTPEVERIIRERNYWDLKLYEDALEIFEKQKETHQQHSTT